MIVYATPEDLSSWVSTVPDNPDVLLRYATILVALACRRDLYTDTPTVEETAVLRDATCVQAASWSALNLDPASLGLDVAPNKRVTLLDATIEKDTATLTAARQAAVNQLAGLAVSLLDAAGLLYRAGPQFDDTGRLSTWGTGPGWWPLNEPLSGELELPWASGRWL